MKHNYTVAKFHQLGKHNYSNSKAAIIFTAWSHYLFWSIDTLTQYAFIKRAKSYNLFSVSILWLAYAALTAFTSIAKGMSENNKHFLNILFLNIDKCPCFFFFFFFFCFTLKFVKCFTWLRFRMSVNIHHILALNHYKKLILRICARQFSSVI